MKINKQDIIFSENDNLKNRSTYHGYYAIKRYNSFGEPLNGNASLCNKNSGIVDENMNYLNIKDIHNDGIKDNVCKKCLNIWNRL